MTQWEKEYAVLRSGIWGTMGPAVLEAGGMLARTQGAAHGLIAYSAGAALEALYRGADIGYGDEVIVGAYGAGADWTAALAVSAAPVFAALEEHSCALSAAAVELAVTPRTKAVVAGFPCDIAAIRAVCTAHGLRLFINGGNGFFAAFRGRPLIQYADAVVFDLSDAPMRLGAGGAVLINEQALYDRVCAFHNCGRPIDAGASLAMGDEIGGDMRAAEWYACLLPDRLCMAASGLRAHAAARRAAIAALPAGYTAAALPEGAAPGYAAPLVRAAAETAAVAYLQERGIAVKCRYTAGYRAPVLQSAYVRRQTGRNFINAPEDRPDTIFEISI